MEKPPRTQIRKLRNQRPLPRHPNSTKNAYILVLGPPNCGKSTTINSLFAHREITNISAHEGTHKIQEFSTNFREQRNLKIIDTPGIGSQNSMWDSKVLASIKKFMDTDDQLRQCIPNVVLIVASFSDPNLTNPNGQFVKSLGAINLLNSRLFDRFSCNVIILLTGFMDGLEDYILNPRLRQDEVMDLVKNYTKFPQMPYIIFGENIPSKSLLSAPHSEYGGGCVKLSYEDVVEDALIYPVNLIDLIVKISGGSTKGALGQEYFKNVFKNRENVFLWKSCELPLVSSDRKRFRKAFYALKEVYKQLEKEEEETMTTTALTQR